MRCFAEFAAQLVIVGQVCGRFNSISGQIRIADERLLSTFEFCVDTASIDTHHTGRDAYLRSPKFFDLQKYLQMTLSDTGIKVEPEGNFTVEGNLTIRKVTCEISTALELAGVVQDLWGNARIAFQTKTKNGLRMFSCNDFGIW